MKRLLALAIATLALLGCETHHQQCHYNVSGDYHCHDDTIYYHNHTSTTVVTTSANNGGGYNNNIIVIEEEPSYCSWDYPYYHDPEYCTFDYDTTCCMWLNIGQEEEWCYYDYCGWELVTVYTYWQEERERDEV